MPQTAFHLMFWHRANLRKDQKLEAIDSSDRSVSVWQLIEPLSHFTDKLNCSSKSSESQYRQLLLKLWRVHPPLPEPSWGPLVAAGTVGPSESSFLCEMKKWTCNWGFGFLKAAMQSLPYWYKAWFILLLPLQRFPFFLSFFSRDISWKIKFHLKSSAQADTVRARRSWRCWSVLSACPALPRQCPYGSAHWG